jgi:SAM-dependent methyltransferase
MSNDRDLKAKKPYRYLLGDSIRESNRLRRQAALWDPHAHDLFDRLKVRRGWKVLEVGPGRGSLHLNLRHRVQGPIDAVERSAVFAKGIRSSSKADRLGDGRIWNCDLLEADLPPDHYDLIFARWVFLFLPDPLGHLKLLVDALKPGGILAIQDYVRDTLNLLPRPPEWDAFMRADRAYFASQGGDVNIGAKLPLLYQQAGLQTMEVRPHIKLGRPGEPTWRWLSDYFLGVMPQYEGLGKFGREHSNSLAVFWRSAARKPNSLIVAPTVLDVIGRKPSIGRSSSV